MVPLLGGDKGISISCHRGTSISGQNGISISINGKVKTGNDGVIIVKYYDSRKNKYLFKVGDIPEELKPNTFYRVVDGEWVETD